MSEIPERTGLICNPARDVQDFHVKFDIHYDGPPRELPVSIAFARTHRTLEEIVEYGQSEGNLPKQLDAWIDLLYFTYGNLHLQGFTPEAINEAWRRVHEANMAKVRSSDDRPGKHKAIGDFVDIAKPPGWTAPMLDDLCQALPAIVEAPVEPRKKKYVPLVGPFRYFLPNADDPYLRRANDVGSELSGNTPNDWTSGSITAQELKDHVQLNEVSESQARERYPHATYE